MKPQRFHIKSRKKPDARKKITHWQIRVGVSGKNVKGAMPEIRPTLEIPNQKIAQSGRRRKRPAGFFAAFVLQKAGFETTIIERGASVENAKSNRRFEKTGEFNPTANYAFGEGGRNFFRRKTDIAST